MAIQYRKTRNPRTKVEESASWINLGSYWLVTFGDGSSYRDTDLPKDDLPSGIEDFFKGFKK